MKIKILTFMIILFYTTPAFAGLKESMYSVFGPGGKGAAVSIIICLAIGSWVLQQVAIIIGKNQFGNWIDLTSKFLGLSVFVSTALLVIGEIVGYVLP